MCNKCPDSRVKPKTMRGKAWVGVWHEPKHRLGWAMPHFVDTYSADTLDEPWVKGSRLYLCRVTLTPYRDKLGRLRSKVIPRTEPKVQHG